jgi:AcrR family transcriptional regulator
MTGVKAKRQYTSTLRQQQASLTRARILDAAQRLFTLGSYGATTMEAIASEAGVATDTVYATFRTKAGLLHKLLDVRVGGDDAPVALLDRAAPQKVRADTSQRRQIAAFAADVAGIQERAVPVDDIMRSAAAVDPEIAALRARMQGHRYENMRKFVSWLAGNGPFRGGISVDEASAIVWTLAGPEVNRLLRTERGWSRDRYVAWLTDTLTRTLLP